MPTLSEVNAQLTRINIRGKEYINVAQRVQGFHMLHDDWSIETKLLTDDGNRCVFKCEVKDAEGRVRATGHAYEISKGMVNSTSYIENCETSAIGRALGMLGIGSTDSIASADEVNNALEKQHNQLTPAQLDVATAMNRAIANGCSGDELNEIIDTVFGINPRLMNDEQCQQAVRLIVEYESERS